MLPSRVFWTRLGLVALFGAIVVAFYVGKCTQAHKNHPTIDLMREIDKFGTNDSHE